MTNKILIINAGSSSIKWKLLDKSSLISVADGVVERIGFDGEQTLKVNGQKYKQKITTIDHKDAIKYIVDFWKEKSVIENNENITNIGFRIVQGGNYFSKASLINEEDILKIAEAGKLAPLHNPGAVQAIRAFREIFPKAILSANFDTAFHRTIPAVNHTYPINSQLAKELSIKKYGMHGISHRYITRKLEGLLDKEKVTFVNLHIGNGASLCAIKDSKSFDTSMGLTPLAGIMMGTRSGDIDPSIHEYVCKAKGISISDFTNILNKKSGLLGVSGLSADMRDITQACLEGNEQAQLTFDLYVQRVVDYTAAFINKLEAPEAIVFTAGVGENSWLFRKSVVEKLKTFGLMIDNDKNQELFEDYIIISLPESKIKIFIMRTDEELMIAKDALSLEKTI